MTLVVTDDVCFRNDTKEDVFVHQVSWICFFVFFFLASERILNLKSQNQSI